MSPEKSVTFGEVEIYQFEREQGHQTVPDKGGASLGMKMQHFELQKSKATYYSRISFLKRYFNSSVLPDSIFPSTPPALSPEVSLIDHQSEASLPSLDTPCPVNYINLKCPHLDEEECNCYPFSSSTGRTANSKEKLKAVPWKERVKILKSCGVKIDDKERYACSKIRDSRRRIGCSCPQGLCNPQTCFCALNGVPCQMDKLYFPCFCNPQTCSNGEGRVEYSYTRVKNHFAHTMKNGRNEVCQLTGDCLECIDHDRKNIPSEHEKVRLSKYPAVNDHSCSQCLESYPKQMSFDESSHATFHTALGDSNFSQTIMEEDKTRNDLHSLSCLPLVNNKKPIETPFATPGTFSRMSHITKDFNFSFTNGLTSSPSSPSLNRLSLRKRKIPKTPLNDYLKDFSTPIKQRTNKLSTLLNDPTDQIITISDTEDDENCQNTPEHMPQTASEKVSPVNRYRSPSAEAIKTQNKVDEGVGMFSAPSSPLHFNY